MNNPKLITEFLGTFFLLSVVAFSGNPLAIGMVLMVLVYAGGHISGAHYNPAVTFAFYIKKTLSLQEAISYVVAQFLGGIAASLVYAMTHDHFLVIQPSITWTRALLIETMFTFLLVWTVLMVAADKRVKGNQYFGLAIGGALMVGAFAGGALSGGAFNPAMGVSPMIVNFTSMLTNPELVVLYIGGPLLGAWLAQWVTQKLLS